MVLWEITLVTAYILGLKRTYRIVLRLERRLLLNHPRAREFVHRRARTVFDVALRVHRAVQGRDIQDGKGFGNRILRILDRLRPTADIRGTLRNDETAPEAAANKQQQQQQPPSTSASSSGASGSVHRNVNFVSNASSWDRYGGRGTAAGVVPLEPAAALAMSLPQVLLTSYWLPLRRRLELKQLKQQR